MLTFMPCLNAQENQEVGPALENLEQEIRVKESLRTEKVYRRADLRRQIAEIQAESQTLEVARQQLLEQVATQREAWDASHQELLEVKTLWEKQARQLVWHVVSTQQLSETNPLTMLVVQSNPLKVDRLYNYHKYFIGHVNTRLDSSEILLASLRTQRANAELNQSKLAQTEESLNRNSNSLTERGLQYQRLTALLQTDIAELESDLALLKDEVAQLNLVIAERTRPAPRDQPIASPQTRSDVSNWPVTGPIRQRFGSQRADGRLRSEGIVIAAEFNTPVTAVAGGTVVFSQWLEGYGNTVIVDHGDEVISIYAHCEDLLKQVNSPVEAGEVLASVGFGSNPNEPGLYFEIRVRSEPTDPLRWLNR